MEEQFKDIASIVKEAGAHNPSSGFSKSVMNEIHLLTPEKPLVYTPLISKKIWFVLALLMACITIGVFLYPSGNQSILDNTDLSFFNFDMDIKNPLAGFTFYKTTLYGISFLAILFLIQIPVFKRRIDQNFSL
ncbi:hypothetical protein [Aquimarina sp. AU474]|uniref:hypothetical protein n=1 Tax=Aquimarina sp. AU474 TaxID=2108529 RepID=UPI000D68B773|nr:hypothetical protein [Aquimarina sp. AU474]